jgi:hypothetical protein
MGGRFVEGRSVEGRYVEGRSVGRTFCSEGRFVEGRFVLVPKSTLRIVTYLDKLLVDNTKMSFGDLSFGSEGIFQLFGVQLPVA